MRRFDEADEFLNRSISIQPDQSHAYHWKCALNLYGRGDIAKARQAMEMAGDEVPMERFLEWLELLLAERNLEAALALIDQLKPDVFEEQYWYVPKSLLRAEVRTLLGSSEDVGGDYRSSQRVYESALRATPDDPRKLIGMAWTLLGLGQVTEAFQHAKAAVETRAVVNDTMAKPLLQVYQATIHARAGDHETALRQIESLLAIPSLFSSGNLRIMPHWDSLRGYPEFQRLANLPPKVF
jgi:tetratricopeptide (TPR) repeat protein